MTNTPSISVSFDRAADYYDETRGIPPTDTDATANCFVAAGELSAASRLLEIGIGTGRIALPLAPHVRQIAGVDISRAMMNRLRAKQTGQPIDPVEASAVQLPFAVGRFDAVVAVHVFHLIADWRGVLRELARALKPGGRLLHGWNNRVGLFPDDLYSRASSRGETASVGVGWKERDSFLDGAGWRRVGDDQTHPFTIQQTPQAVIDQVAGRRWSHQWAMSDDEVAAGVALLTEYARDNFPDLTTPIPLTDTFRVRAYLPPITPA